MNTENADGSDNGTPPEDRTQTQPDAEPTQGQPTPTVRRSRRIILIGIGVAITVGAACALVALALQPSALEHAGDACSGTAPLEQIMADDPDGLNDLLGEDTAAEYFRGVVSVEDGGKTLIVSTLPRDEDPLGVSSLALSCVQHSLGMPTWLSESIGQTRSLDGRQNAEWDAYSAQWSYHPDSGLNLIIIQQ